ncbi:MAG: alpha/beta hydrolase [Paracoccaceae bacterium]|nr:MAG: alpha/beta hydrolase [Paracoccaceae bacterium]
MTTKDPYRIRDFVPEFDGIAAEIADRSRQLAATASMWSGSAYGAGARERIDILLPTRLRAGAPIHMFVHGGYWRSGEKAAYTCVAAPVLAVGGIAAIVEYDLMPGTRLGAIVDQVRRAAAWLAARAGGLGADPARLTVSGHSAGAHLASFLAATGPEEGRWPLTPIAGLMLVSGIYDLVDIPSSFLRHEARMTPAEAEAWTPLSSRHHPGPERIVAVGEQETPPFHDQARQLCQLLRSDGIRSDLVVTPGLNHMDIVLDLADPRRPLGQRLSTMVEESRRAVA